MRRQTRDGRRRQERRENRKEKKRKKRETKGFVNKEENRIGREETVSMEKKTQK